MTRSIDFSLERRCSLGDRAAPAPALFRCPHWLSASGITPPNPPGSARAPEQPTAPSGAWSCGAAAVDREFIDARTALDISTVGQRRSTRQQHLLMSSSSLLPGAANRPGIDTALATPVPPAFHVPPFLIVHRRRDDPLRSRCQTPRRLHLVDALVTLRPLVSHRCSGQPTAAAVMNTASPSYRQTDGE